MKFKKFKKKMEQYIFTTGTIQSPCLVGRSQMKFKARNVEAPRSALDIGKSAHSCPHHIFN